MFEQTPVVDPDHATVLVSDLQGAKALAERVVSALVTAVTEDPLRWQPTREDASDILRHLEGAIWYGDRMRGSQPTTDQRNEPMKLEKLEDENGETNPDATTAWFSVPTVKRRARDIAAVRLEKHRPTYSGGDGPSHSPPYVEIIFGTDGPGGGMGRYFAPRETFSGADAIVVMSELARIGFIDEFERDAMEERFQLMEFIHQDACDIERVSAKSADRTPTPDDP